MGGRETKNSTIARDEGGGRKSKKRLRGEQEYWEEKKKGALLSTSVEGTLGDACGGVEKGQRGFWSCVVANGWDTPKGGLTREEWGGEITRETMLGKLAKRVVIKGGKKRRTGKKKKSTAQKRLVDS